MTDGLWTACTGRNPRKWDLFDKGGAAEQPGELLKPLRCSSAWGQVSSFCWCSCRKRNLLACGWTDLHRLLLSALVERVLCVVETTLSFPCMSWSYGDTCSHVAMAMEEEFGSKLTMMSITHYSSPHPEEIPKLFWWSSLKLSFIIPFLSPPEGDKILFTLISILSLLTI